MRNAKGEMNDELGMMNDELKETERLLSAICYSLSAIGYPLDNAECGMRKAKLWVAARRLYCLIDRLLADEAVFFAYGSQECEPYNQIVALG